MTQEDDTEISYLRYYIAHLVRVWTSLSIVRNDKTCELCRVFQDLCSDKLRIMLHELAHKESWTLGFSPDANIRYQRLYERLVKANSWFESTTTTNRKKKKGLHYRNCSGAHLQPLDRAEHMFQQFGYGGEREWKHLTKGVAACIAMMNLIDEKPRRDYWRKVRHDVRSPVKRTHTINVGGSQKTVEVPIEIEALVLSFEKWD